MGETMDDRRRAAIRRLRARRGFRQHLVLYAAVNGFLVLRWAIADGTPPTFWAWQVVWGILLALHGWRVYGQRPITEAEIQREMEKDGVTESSGAVTSPR